MKHSKFLLFLAISVLSLAGCSSNNSGSTTGTTSGSITQTTTSSSVIQNAYPIKIEYASDVSNIQYLLGMEFNHVDKDGKSKIPDLKVTYSDGQVKDILHTDERTDYVGYDAYTEGEQIINVYFTDVEHTIRSSYKVDVINDGPKFAKNLSDQTVKCPDSVTFEVRMANTELMYFYEWQDLTILDGVVHSVRKIRCTNSNQLTIKSTRFDGYNIRVVVTDENGKTSYSNISHVTVTGINDQPVFYFAEYAIKPGETFDISKYYGDNFGYSGVIAFSSDATSITLTNCFFNNVCYEVDEFYYSYTFWYEYHKYPTDQFNVNVVGDNRFINYYDSDGSSIFFLLNNQNGEALINFTGSGSLALSGGAISIMTQGSIQIDCKLDCHTGSYTGAIGISSRESIYLTSNANLTINSSIMGIKNSGSFICEEGSITKIDLYPAYGPNGDLPAIGIASAQMIELNKSKLDVNLHINTCMFFEKQYELKSSSGINSERIKITSESIVNINIETTNHSIDDAFYISGISGISGSDIIFGKDCKVNINIEALDVLDITGITGTKLQFINGCNVAIDVKAIGQVYGISCLSQSEGSGLFIHDALIDVSVDVVHLPTVPSVSMGIIAYNLELKLEESSLIHILNKDTSIKPALGVYISTFTKEQTYEEGYVAEFLDISQCNTDPSGLEVNKVSCEFDGNYLVFESLYKTENDINVQHKIISEVTLTKK